MKLNIVNCSFPAISLSSQSLTNSRKEPPTPNSYIMAGANTSTSQGKCDHPMADINQFGTPRQEQPNSSSTIFPAPTQFFSNQKHLSSIRQQYSNNTTTRIPYRIFLELLHCSAYRYLFCTPLHDPGRWARAWTLSAERSADWVMPSRDASTDTL